MADAAPDWINGDPDDLRRWRNACPEVVNPVLPDDVAITPLAPDGACPGGLICTPDRVAGISDATMAGLVGDRLDAAKTDAARARIIDDARFDLGMKLQGFISDEVGFGVIEPDAASRRFLLRGTRPGTVAGEALRFIAQFKGFPIAFAQRVGGRAVMGAVGETALERSLHRAGHIGALQAGMFVAGYMAMTAKDFARGYGPRDPDKKETIAAAMMRFSPMP